MEKTFTLKVGESHTISILIDKLLSFGYESDPELVSGRFNHLGGDIKIFPTNKPQAIRVSFFGDEIESVAVLDNAGKLKVEEVQSLELADNSLNIEGLHIFPGNCVVHIDHGVGVFSHKEVRKIGSELIDYIVISYLNDDILRVPVTQIDKLSRYIGIGKRRPRLSKLGSETWKKTYKKTYEDVIKMARELLFIYAERQISKKKKLTFHPTWEKAIQQTFEFVETPDQIQTIKEIYQDQMSEKPMDRLICGDVGFGKTEVALRAITQAVANGYQAAVLVPTTILCEQHFLTFQKRLANLPVRVAKLSRFSTSGQTKETLEDINNGKIDILISTHKILRGIVNFKNLGLLVVDEEQKFGVKDKEKLKKIRSAIDVLVLTATPIPRTMFMALSGLRDISRLYSAPAGRKSVETVVTKYDLNLIVEAIMKEVARKGQVYYLYNNVAKIGAVRAKLNKAMPGVSIAVAHGQMAENQLLEVMSDFTAGKIDVLVCSTIIENGLDLPNVNTLIVEESDRFGLSQLYQIRGRIGRSKKQSYAYFTYPQKLLTENASKRLKSMAENTELGTGYEIALQDLEIRGGGNVLGRDQSGNMEAVGLILYSKMLKIAVDNLIQLDHGKTNRG